MCAYLKVFESLRLRRLDVEVGFTLSAYSSLISVDFVQDFLQDRKPAWVDLICLICLHDLAEPALAT